MEHTTYDFGAHYSHVELFLAYREEANCEPVTLRNYRIALSRFLASPRVPDDIAELSADHIVLYLAELRRAGLAPSTRAWHQRHILAFVRWLQDRDVIPRDIARLVKRVAVPKTRKRSTGTDVMTRALTVAAQGREMHLRDVAILRLLWATGLRRRELCDLQLADVDLRSGEVFVTYAKGKKQRRVPFDGAAKVALLEYIHGKRGEEPGPLFLKRGGAGIDGHTVYQLLRRIAKRAGVDVELAAHDFRRGLAARARRAGLDIAHVASLLGHETLVMTLEYTAEGEEDAAIAAYRERLG